MIKEIKYKGFTATPSDYECPDGELDAAINLVPDNGELAPIQKGESLFHLGSVYKILFIHKNATYRHIILSGEHNEAVLLYWIDIPNEGRLTDALKSISANTTSANTTPEPMDQHSYNIGTELSVSAIGNTLIVTGDGNMHYILWKDNSYKYLGTHIPEIYLSFSLKGTVDYRTPEGGFAFDSSTLHVLEGERYGSEYYQIISYAASKISDQVMGFVVEKTKAIKDAGYFVHPFFVRYALRLYDGTLTMHSAPILMNPCTTCNPFVYASSASESSVNVVAMFVKSELECMFLKVISGTLDDWEDIITGIDIFVSNQMCPYNQDGKIQGIETTTDITVANTVTTGRGGGQSQNIRYEQKSTKISESVFIGRLSTNSGDNYAQHKFTHIYGNNPRRRDGSTLDDTTYEGGSWPKYAFMLPYIEEDKVKENIINESRFYYLSSIRLEELNSYTTRKKVEFNITRTEEDVPGERTEDVYTSALTSLLGAEVMTDDYHSHDTISPNSVFDYNSRLHLAGITRTLFNGFPLSSMLAYCNKRYNYSQGSFDYVNYADKYCIEVYLKIDGVNTKVVCRLDDYGVLLQNYLSDSQNGTLQPESWGCYLFYPDRNAYKMRIIHKGTDPFKNTTGDYFDIELKPHDFINGAYAFLDYYTIREKTGHTSVLSESTNVRVSELGKIYTSDANNPFIFSTTNINTIGTGEILALATATKALSQGQFGQFPLYAFTTEGVWALEVAANGAFSAKQPITRDVCINADSITQLDNAVIFVTDRGIMLISGSDSICISDSINAESVFSINALPKLSDVCEEDINIGTVVPFMQFLHDARMFYDYTHQRIIVNNIDHDYAYVYSLKSKAWGMMKSDIAYGFPSYPECLAVDANHNIVNLSSTAQDAQAGSSNGYPQDNTVNALLITRPLKLDAPDILKTVDTIIQRGKFRKGNVMSILYGSRDLYNWHLVYSSNDHYLRGFRGTPYKYFRIVLLCKLQEDESIFGCTVQFTPRLIDQPR